MCLIHDILHELMQNYELTIVIAGGASAAKKKAAQERIEKLVKLFSGSVVSFSDWGEISLSYKIKKQTNGVFLHFVVDLDPANVKSISDKLKIEEDIIRSLLVKYNQTKKETKKVSRTSEK